jgi:hypothetical protein
MSRSNEVEYANGRHIEARSLAAYMLRNGASRAIALKAQAAAELREELPSNVDADTFQKLLEQRCAILGGK